MSQKIKPQKGFIPIILVIVIAVAVILATAGIVKYKDEITASVSDVFKSKIETSNVKFIEENEAIEESELTEKSIAGEEAETEKKQDNTRQLQEQLRIAEQKRLEAEKQLAKEKTKEENRIRAEQQKLQNQQVQLPPPNSILCNGKYWSSCPDGQIFYCPSTTGNPQCIAENTQTYIDSLSGLQKMRDCMKSATERYQEAKALAEADEKKCKEEGHDPMICFIRGTAPSIASYYSSCLGVSRISENESKYYLPPSSYDLDKLQRQLDELERETEEQKRKFQKYQFDQSLNCTLSGGYYIGNICYPSLLK